MKLTSFLLPLFALVSSAAAQNSHIGYPPNGATVRKGENVTVQIVVPDSIMGSIEVGLVLSFQYCGTPNPCPPATQQLGTVLFVGQLHARFHEIPGEPYENFTVTIPDYDFLEPGPGEIIATRFHLIGAGPAPVLETNVINVTYAD